MRIGGKSTIMCRSLSSIPCTWLDTGCASKVMAPSFCDHKIGKSGS